METCHGPPKNREFLNFSISARRGSETKIDVQKEAEHGAVREEAPWKDGLNSCVVQRDVALPEEEGYPEDTCDGEQADHIC